MDERAASFREAVDRSKDGQTRWRCPESLRSEIVSYARERQTLGDGIGSIAADVGLSESCLGRWLRAPSGGFRRVRISQPTTESASGDLVLVTPRGFRVEGLSLPSALRLLLEL